MRFLNSVKSLYAAVGILVLMMGLGSYVDFKSETMHAQQLEINVSLEKMVRLNQELGSMLVIAALKNNALGTASYETVKNDLRQTMDTVTELTKTRGFLQEITSLSETQAQLRAMETKALALINDEDWAAASAILFGDDYMLTKKTYEIDSESAVSAVTGELAASAQHVSRIRDGALALRMTALVLLLWVGVMFSRRSRDDLAEQTRLRGEITDAYREMEARVQQRTADLATTSERLTEENAQREKSDRRSRLILNSAGEGIIGLDASGHGVFINQAGTALLGYADADILDQEIRALIHHQRADGSPLPATECPLHLACLEARACKISDQTLWRKSASGFLAEYSVTPILNEHGDNEGAVVVFRDITEQRRNERELQQRMDELQRFNRLTIGREERMIALKQEINQLLAELGREQKYADPDAGNIDGGIGADA